MTLIRKLKFILWGNHLWRWFLNVPCKFYFSYFINNDRPMKLESRLDILNLKMRSLWLAILNCNLQSLWLDVLNQELWCLPMIRGHTTSQIVAQIISNLMAGMYSDWNKKYSFQKNNDKLLWITPKSLPDLSDTRDWMFWKRHLTTYLTNLLKWNKTQPIRLCYPEFINFTEHQWRKNDLQVTNDLTFFYVL